MDMDTNNKEDEPASQIDKLEDVFKGSVQNKQIVIDRRKDELILTEECKKVMKNLSRIDAGPMDFSSMNTDDLTQPSFLSADEKILFFKMKMFYLLQERSCWIKNQTNAEKKIADPYPIFLSPFAGESADGYGMLSSQTSKATTKKKKKRRGQPGQKATEDMESGSMSSPGASPSSKSKIKDLAKHGINSFLDCLRKADQSTFRMLDEKIMKTAEGKGFACLFSPGITKTDMELSIFPDYAILMNDGNDEESKLNNLMTHVRTRTKIFEKMQAFYETPKEDNLANVFTTQNTDVTEINFEIQEFANKKIHKLDMKKMNKLFDSFKDDYASAKTTLIADGTQPVVLNRKKAERIKKYVDEYADLKTMLVPYNRETNFMFMTVPWQREEETKDKDSTVQPQRTFSQVIPPAADE